MMTIATLVNTATVARWARVTPVTVWRWVQAGIVRPERGATGSGSAMAWTRPQARAVRAVALLGRWELHDRDRCAAVAAQVAELDDAVEAAYAVIVDDRALVVTSPAVVAGFLAAGWPALVVNLTPALREPADDDEVVGPALDERDEDPVAGR